MPSKILPDRAQAWHDTLNALVLAVACLITYLLASRVVPRIYFISEDDELLGGMWATIATIFVMREGYQQSITAAASRMAATLVSFAICLLYLLFLPFHPWALALLTGASALIVTLIGRAGDAVTAAITTAVVMGVVAVTPEDAWQQPILRLADTAVGVAVGIAAVWLLQRIVLPRLERPGGARPASGAD